MKAEETRRFEDDGAATVAPLARCGAELETACRRFQRAQAEAEAYRHKYIKLMFVCAALIVSHLVRSAW